MALDGHHRIIADSSQSSYVKLFGMITLWRKKVVGLWNRLTQQLPWIATIESRRRTSVSCDANCEQRRHIDKLSMVRQHVLEMLAKAFDAERNGTKNGRHVEATTYVRTTYRINSWPLLPLYHLYWLSVVYDLAKQWKHFQRNGFTSLTSEFWIPTILDDEFHSLFGLFGTSCHALSTMCGNSSLFLEDLHHETQWYYVLLRRRQCREEVTLMVRICVFLSVLSIWCSILKQSSTVTVKSTSATASLTTFVSCVEVGDNNTIWYIIE